MNAKLITLASSFALAAGVPLVASAAETAKDTKEAKPATVSTAAVKPTATGAKESPATRDWSQVDTNKDGLVSPEEMEKYLAANPGPLRK